MKENHLFFFILILLFPYCYNKKTPNIRNFKITDPEKAVIKAQGISKAYLIGVSSLPKLLSKPGDTIGMIYYDTSGNIIMQKYQQLFGNEKRYRYDSIGFLIEHITTTDFSKQFKIEYSIINDTIIFQKWTNIPYISDYMRKLNKIDENKIVKQIDTNILTFDSNGKLTKEYRKNHCNVFYENNSFTIKYDYSINQLIKMSFINAPNEYLFPTDSIIMTFEYENDKIIKKQIKNYYGEGERGFEKIYGYPFFSSGTIIYNEGIKDMLLINNKIIIKYKYEFGYELIN